MSGVFLGGEPVVTRPASCVRVFFQFLFEAVFLSVLGGAAGLLIVYLITFIPFGDLEVVLSTKNIILGLSVSSVIGILSGIIPARSAARLDPVIAIRSK